MTAILGQSTGVTGQKIDISHRVCLESIVNALKVDSDDDRRLSKMAPNWSHGNSWPQCGR